VDEPTSAPPQTIEGRVVAVLRTADPGHFETVAVETLALGLAGIDGDRHAGHVRRSGGREPWYARGTPIRNDRQVTVVSVEELAEVAARLGVAVVEPAWIGANLVIEGVPRLSFLPRGSRIVLAGGAVVAVEDQNAPCRIAGRGIAGHLGDAALELAFPREARGLRGVVASVERAGEVATGDTATVKVPEQWLYRP